MYLIHQKMEKTDEDSNDLCSEEGSNNNDKIRVGKDYQAVVPDIFPSEEREVKLKSTVDRALLVWRPTDKVSDKEINEYLKVAKDKYKYSIDQALGMLYWHKYDVQSAISDLTNFLPFTEEWSADDKMIFEQSFLFNGKNFHQIRQSLPEKTIGTLVKYYYSWKKTKTRTSLMDEHIKNSTNNNNNNNSSNNNNSNNGTNGNNEKDEVNAGSDIVSEAGSNSDSDGEDKRVINRGVKRDNGSPTATADYLDKVKDEKDTSRGNNKCSNCSILCTYLHPTTKGAMCRTCMLYFKKTGLLRPTVGPIKSRSDRHASHKNKCNPPRGMYVNHDDLLTLSSHSETGSKSVLRKMDTELIVLKQTMQLNRQKITVLKSQLPENIDSYREADMNVSRINSRWTNDELLLAVQGVRKYGKDFKTIAEVIGTKTEAHIKTFYSTYKNRYNLDGILNDHNMENGVDSDMPNDDACDMSIELSEKDDDKELSLPDKSLIAPASSLPTSLICNK